MLGNQIIVQSQLNDKVCRVAVRSADVVKTASLQLRAVHATAVRARVVDSLQLDLDTAQYNVAQLMRQAMRLDALLDAAMAAAGDALETLYTAPGGEALTLRYRPALCLWQRVHAVSSLYPAVVHGQQSDDADDDAVDDEERARQRVWRDELMPQWPAKRGVIGARLHWFNGVPPQHRAVVWRMAVDNSLSLTRAM
jgi:hypothetical protein